ncbi:putative nuclease HARBI1 [Salarias fasciatus]|uniref:putative nuclease HARBI1 n=1 Tax=Salarias fasciatus TaxID=181472 RepID=UPI0011770BEB|nr:putative nuclease HARBI1 [Salarias fasciatus]
MYFDGHSELRPDFRLHRTTISALTDLLWPRDHQGWGRHLDTLVFLFWLASGTSYRVVARAFDIPRSTVCDVAHRVADQILSIRRRLISFPPAEELEDISTGFQQLGGCASFQRVVGAIDGCHVRITPPAEHAECYLNRKLFHSVQFQAVTDHQGRFLDIFVGYPGSVHDSRVLRNSPIYMEQLYPPAGFVLLGDGGYPCLSRPITILTPYRQPVRNPVEARFNRHHSRARSVVERAFGIMKARWRAIFFKALEVQPTFAVKVIACCAVLHNLCLRHGDLLEPEPVQEPETEAVHHEQDNQGQQSGESLRAAMAAALSAPRERHQALRDHDY